MLACIEILYCSSLVLQKISLIQDIEDGRHGKVGKQYLTWVLNNVEIKDALLKEAVKFYKDYFYLPGDGYD